MLNVIQVSGYYYFFFCDIQKVLLCRLSQLLAGHASPPSSGIPCSQKKAQVKLKALNLATFKLASQLEKSEAENNRLKLRLEKVHVHVHAYRKV